MIEPTATTMPIAPLQRQFTAALMRPELPVPEAIAGNSDARRIKRFNVYRNNVHASLAVSLAARFPVVERLVGETFFRAMALVFVEHHPPSSSVLAEYGGHFPVFLESFEPVAELPYLPDIARLEWLRNVAYHAADADPIAISALADVPPHELAHARLVPHTAMSCIVSDYPIVSLWSTNTHDQTVAPIGADAVGETALVTRPSLNVLVTALPPGAGAFLQALEQGNGFDLAVRRTTALRPAFDLPATLAALFGSGAIMRVEMPVANPGK
jgi:hypothetical protein